jgi:tryptophan halogenase
MEFLAEDCDQWFGTHRPDTRVPKYVMDRLAEAPHTLPPHDVWLQRVLGMPAYSQAGSAK